jgi:hypothetical protein
MKIEHPHLVLSVKVHTVSSPVKKRRRRKERGEEEEEEEDTELKEYC